MRRAQAAVEYLMMLAVALTMVMLVVRYVREAAEMAGKNVNSSTRQIASYISKTIENETKGE
jgi:uncharacterized protein (UPF0333 family)